MKQEIKQFKTVEYSSASQDDTSEEEEDEKDKQDQATATTISYKSGQSPRQWREKHW